MRNKKGQFIKGHKGYRYWLNKKFNKKHKEKLRKSHWKGGKMRSEGYIRIYSPNHPQKSKLGYVPEHRLVMERKLGRYLKSKEIVHHINGIRDDNRINNLKLIINQSQHIKEEAKNNKNWGIHLK